MGGGFNLMNIHLTHNQHTHVDCKKRLEIGEEIRENLTIQGTNSKIDSLSYEFSHAVIKCAIVRVQSLNFSCIFSPVLLRH